MRCPMGRLAILLLIGQTLIAVWTVRRPSWIPTKTLNPSVRLHGWKPSRVRFISPEIRGKQRLFASETPTNQHAANATCTFRDGRNHQSLDVFVIISSYLYSSSLYAQKSLLSSHITSWSRHYYYIASHCHCTKKFLSKSSGDFMWCWYLLFVAQDDWFVVTPTTRITTHGISRWMDWNDLLTYRSKMPWQGIVQNVFTLEWSLRSFSLGFLNL